MLRDETIFVSNPLLCLQGRLSEWPSYLHDLFVSSYLHFLNTSFSKFYHSRSPFIRPSITWQKKSLQCFVQRISRAYPGNFIVILNNFRLPRQEETINKNKQNKTQQKIDICIFVFVCLRPKLKEKCRDFFYLFFFTSLLHVPDAVFIRGRHLFWNCTYQGWQQGLIIWKILCKTCRYFFSCWDVTHGHFSWLVKETEIQSSNKRDVHWLGTIGL